MEELRNQGYLDIGSVEYAVLETDGRLSVIPYPSEAPVTPAQLKLEAEDTGYPVVVISDGHVIRSNLRLVGRDMNWLKKRLAALGVKDAEQVFLMTVNSAGQVYYAPKEPEQLKKRFSPFRFCFCFSPLPFSTSGPLTGCVWTSPAR